MTQQERDSAREKLHEDLKDLLRVSDCLQADGKTSDPRMYACYLRIAESKFESLFYLSSDDPHREWAWMNQFEAGYRTGMRALFEKARARLCKAVFSDEGAAR